jgi:hypothetical protein
MKTSAVFALALLAATPFAVAQESKDAKIERLLDAMNAQSTIDQMFEQIKAMTASQIPPGATPEQAAKAHELQSKIMDLIKARMGWERMRPQYAKMYGETFSDQEISGMLAFYQSPAGRAMLSKMPALMAKVMELTQAQMADLLPEIQRITRDAMPK